jgi:hypothetical protein
VLSRPKGSPLSKRISIILAGSLALAAAGGTASLATAEQGADDPPGDVRQARGTDDSASHSGADDAVARATGDGDRGRVLRSGRCSGPSTWKLKAKPDDGRLEVEFEVDRNRAGVRFAVVMRRNGVVFVRTTRVTAGRSGSFSIERRTGNRAGVDRITAVATRRGETCRASLSI